MTTWPRGWLGPLGRYRPGIFRRDMAAGFGGRGHWSLPGWWPRFPSPEERLLEELDLRGQVVYDVGAFTGGYALFFSRRVGSGGYVVAFEPQAGNFAEMVRVLGHNRVHNVRALPLALGAAAAVRELRGLPGMATTASLAAEACTPLRRPVGTARIEALDQLAGRLRLPAPDFMKIDVEGLELEVLLGARATLAEHHPALLVEVHGSSRGDKADRMQRLASFLRPLGYSLTHTESGRAVTAFTPAWGHVYARAA